MKKTAIPKRLLALLMTLVLVLGMIPLYAGAASQENIYHDPAENWRRAEAAPTPSPRTPPAPTEPCGAATAPNRKTAARHQNPT